jgi:hypothetical protein
MGRQGNVAIDSIVMTVTILLTVAANLLFQRARHGR